MKHFEARSAYNDAQERGFYTACGLWSPETRHQSPRYGAAMVVYPLPATKEQLSVTCKRCQRALTKQAKKRDRAREALYNATMRDG